MRTVGATCFGSAVVYTTYLSWWQFHRREWKIALTEERTQRLEAEAVPLSSLVPLGEAVSTGAAAVNLSPEVAFRRVVCRGTFDHEHSFLLGPRSAPVGSATSTTGTVGAAGAVGASGWDVVTPLDCDDGRRILVNRGWVPRQEASAISLPTGVVGVHGVLRDGEAGNRFAKNDDASRRYVWLDLPSMATSAATAPLIVYAVETGVSGTPASATPTGTSAWPAARPLSSFVDFHVKPWTHMAYSCTWGAVSVAGAAITFMRFVR